MGLIVVNNLGKAYKQYRTRWSRLIEWIFPDDENPQHTKKWVLQGISFEIKPGEAVGVVGTNGAGKSTLLKMITGTVQPSTGEVYVRGRVAALLELGMGFHPDFTGRQNVIMAGQLQGLTVEKIQALMPEIESFAGIGDYIDQPVRVYSSGMQIRLAFSVATAIRPDILIVDEALSVGDRFFAQKSFSRIKGFLDQGTTLLLVSHDATAIKALCDKAILLENGRLAMCSDPETVMDRYAGLVLKQSNQLASEREFPSGDMTTADGELPAVREVEGFAAAHEQLKTGEVRLSGIRILNSKGARTSSVVTGEEITISYVVTASVDLEDVYFGISLRDRLAITIFNTTTIALGMQGVAIRQGGHVELRFRMKVPIQTGNYGVCMGVVSNHLGGGNFERYMLHVVNAEILEIVGTGAPARFGGIVDLAPKCEVKVY